MNDDNIFKEISFTDVLKTRSIYVPNFIFSFYIKIIRLQGNMYFGKKKKYILNIHTII